MDSWKSWKDGESSVLAVWYRRIRESYVAAWLFGVFQSPGMSASTTVGGGGGGGGGGGVGGALSLMGCVREASPPPQNHHYQQHHHHHHHHHNRASTLEEFTSQNNAEPAPKEPKKRRFHPLRGLRKIFRRKSRGAADVRLAADLNERNGEESSRGAREDIGGPRRAERRPEEARSRSASELLTDSCEHDSVFLRRSGAEDAFVKLRGGTGKLSVSHDSVFPGEVPNTRPLTSLDSLATLERRQGRASNEIEHKEYSQQAAHRHRISLRVLEQIKTVIENRNQLASATSADTSSNLHTVGEHYQQETTENRFTCFERHEKSGEENQAKVPRPPKDTVDRVVPKEDLPELETASLNHTAALHRISVRPKNRRPPRRTAAQSNANNAAPASTITTIAEHAIDSLEQQPPPPPPPPAGSAASSPTVPKKTSITRKSSSRLSRASDIFEELESRLPSRKPSSVASLSPDSLDAATLSRSSAEGAEEQAEMRSGRLSRKASNRVSKGSDIFEELEAKLPRRRSSSNRLSKSPDSLEVTSCWFSKSTEGFDKLVENEESKPVARRLMNSMSKSSDRVSKSSDSLEAIEALTSDDSMERRRSSFEFHARRSSKAMSKSSESFEIIEQEQSEAPINRDSQNRSSVSDVSLPRRRLSKSISKSSESFERIQISESKDEDIDDDDDLGKNARRSSKRMSSESSDNLELEEKLENRRVRRPPKRIPSTSVVDIVSADDPEDERRPTPTRKPSRLQKSSESSELGSTDTLDSEKRNKSSESCETLDSLEKDLEQDRKEEEMTDSADRREKNDSWSSRSMTMTDSDQASMADGADDSKAVIPSEKYYWRQSSETKENIDIHQLLAITIVTRMTDNGNNQRSSVIYPKKKQQMTSSPPISPVVKQEDNKLLFDNLLASKNDEDLQNMLNGNISEVSTDTKSFKEKLIMFEKLGK